MNCPAEASSPRAVSLPASVPNKTYKNKVIRAIMANLVREKTSNRWINYLPILASIIMLALAVVVRMGWY